MILLFFADKDKGEIKENRVGKIDFGSKFRVREPVDEIGANLAANQVIALARSVE